MPRASRRLTTTARGYGYSHKRERERWRPFVEAGEVDCWRCGMAIAADAEWDLGHDDRNRGIYRGPEHITCNRSAAARIGNRMRGRRPARSHQSWPL